MKSGSLLPEDRIGTNALLLIVRPRTSVASCSIVGELKMVAMGSALVERLVDLRKEFYDHQRVAAHLEEIRPDSDRIYIQHSLPNPDHSLASIRISRSVESCLTSHHRETGMHNAQRCPWQTIKHMLSQEEGYWNHVTRQTHLSMHLQILGLGETFRGSVGTKYAARAFVRGSLPLNCDQALTDAGILFSETSISPNSMRKPSNLDLVIDTAEETR